MTNKELKDAAWSLLMTTDISGKTWLDRVTNGYKGKPYNSAATAFGKAQTLLNQIENLPIIDHDFTMSPENPKVGEEVTFSVVNPISGLIYGWDRTLDGTQDSVGQVFKFAYTTEGQKTMQLVVDGVVVKTKLLTVAPAPVTPPPSGSRTVDAWQTLLQPNNYDIDSGVNDYSAGWIKSRRVPAPAGWENQGLLIFSDYPNEYCQVDVKRFRKVYGGRITNFHLTGTDYEIHNGVSPIALDWHASLNGLPSDIPQGSVVLSCQAEKDGTNNRMHWLVVTKDEALSDPNAVWKFEWAIKWKNDRTGYVHINVYKNNVFVRKVTVDNIRTYYVEQTPRVYVWLGGYLSYVTTAYGTMEQSLDYRGKTIAEAYNDMPVFGSIMHTNAKTSGATDSSVAKTNQLSLGTGQTTNPPVEPPPLASEVLGVPWNSTGLANLEIGKYARQVGYLFKAMYSEKLSGVRVFLKQGSGYSAGDGGTIRVDLYAADSNGLPTGPSLGNYSISNPTSSQFWTFPLSASLVAGNKYCLVWSNTSSGQATNYVSLNNMDCDPSLSPRQPEVLDNELGVFYKDGSASFAFHPKRTPIFDLMYESGKHQGQTYDDFRSQSGLTTLGSVTENITPTKSGAYNTVQAWVSGTGSATFEINGKTVTVSKNTSGRGWIKGSLSVDLVAGTSYKLKLTGVSGSLTIFPYVKGKNQSFSDPFSQGSSSANTNEDWPMYLSVS